MPPWARRILREGRWRVKIAFLSDAHGNEIGLSTCLDAIKGMGVEEIAFLGDAVGYFPGGKECTQVIMNECDKFVFGGHEGMLLGRVPLQRKRDLVYQLASQQDQAREAPLSRLNEWPDMRKFEFHDVRICIVHGTIADPLLGYLYPDGEVELPEDFDCDVLVMGHTHYPFIKKVADVLVVNCGSCGLPRDVGNLASFAVFETETRKMEIIRVPIDVEAILDRYPTVHEAVRECLYRTADEFVGELVS